MARLASIEDIHTVQGAQGPEPGEHHLTVSPRSNKTGQQQEQVEANRDHSKPKTYVRAFRGQLDPLSNFYHIGGEKAAILGEVLSQQ